MNLVDQAAELILGARYAVALTGAGVSTRSGVPDFRSPGSGLWEKADPYQVASILAFRRKPEAFYAWITPMARRIVEAQPNGAHLALAQLEAAGCLKAVITQNIDGLHQRAGSRQVAEIHGHIREATCVRCYRVVPTGPFIQRFLDEGKFPACAHCGNLLKPNVILFGEQLPALAVQEAQRQISRCDLVLVAGSSLEVAPVSELPRLARERGARLVIVNLQPTYLDDQADVIIHADVADILPQMARLCGAA